MSREFTEQHVRALCLLAGIEPRSIFQVENQYWPDAYVEERKRSPWFVVTTPAGAIRMGWRKRVLSIEWSDTPVRKVSPERNAGVPSAFGPSVTISGEDAHFLAVRLRRLCAHLNYTLPKFAEDDAALVNIAGTVIGALLTNLTHGVEMPQPGQEKNHG